MHELCGHDDSSLSILVLMNPAPRCVEPSSQVAMSHRNRPVKGRSVKELRLRETLCRPPLRL